MIRSLTQHLSEGASLSRDQVTEAVQDLVSEDVPADAKADFLSALATKGETVEEIAEFARLLREKSVIPPIAPELRAQDILDVVGTGGDKLHTFNFSTAAALICAAGGVVVAKHGNRAITSKSGSADVLDALGIPIDQSPEQAATALREHGFAFFFAPNYHPAFKHIGPARKLCAERGQRTIFNFLGPLLNPARPSAMLVGVSRPELCEPFATVLQSLGVRRGMVVCGTVPVDGEERRMDEMSTLGETTVAEFYQQHALNVSTLTTEAFSIQPATIADLGGGAREENAETMQRLFAGEETGPRRDAVVLNAAGALFVAGQCRSLAEGWDQATEIITSGAATAKLAELSGNSEATS